MKGPCPLCQHPRTTFSAQNYSHDVPCMPCISIRPTHLAGACFTLVSEGLRKVLQVQLAKLFYNHIQHNQSGMRLLRAARYAQGRVALVGDAAGYVTKCSGEGIYFAAKSGRMCAEAVVAASQNGALEDHQLLRGFQCAWLE